MFGRRNQKEPSDPPICDAEQQILQQEAAALHQEVVRTRQEIDAGNKTTATFASAKYTLLMETAGKQGHFALAAEFAVRAKEALLLENEIMTAKVRRQVKWLEKARQELDERAQQRKG